VAPLLLLAIVCGFYWKLLSQQYTWMDQPDMAYQVLPWYQMQAEAWHHGRFPLWDPHIWGGQPLLGQVITGAAYPLNWLLFLLPFQNGHIQFRFLDLYYVLTHYMAALLGYWLCRDLGRTRAASMIGGLAFGLMGLFGTLGWPQMLNGAVWTPLLLLFILRSMRNERHFASAVFGGFFLGVAFLSGHHQIPIFLALMAAGLWVTHVWRRRWDGLKAGVLFFLFAGLTGGLQILPAMEAGKLSVRWVGTTGDPLSWAQKVPYMIHEKYSVLPTGILSLVLPSVGHKEIFVGLGVVILAAIGVARSFGHPEVKRLVGVCAGAIVFAIGSTSIFHGVAYWLVPMVEKARSPEMAMVIANAAMAALAAYGVDAIRSGVMGSGARDAGWIQWLSRAGFGALAAVALMASVRNEASLEYERLLIFAFVALALALLLRGWSQLTDRNAVAVLFVVVLFEWGTYVGGNYRDVEHPAGFLAQLNQNQDIAAFLRNAPNFGRLEVKMEDVPYNFGDWEGIDQRSGYLASLTANAGAAPEEAFAANYYLAKNPTNPNQVEVFRGASGLRVFSNPGATPFVRAVHEQKPCAGDDDVKLEWRGGSHIAVRSAMACAGTLVLSETFYPGWKASVDGRSRTIRQMFGAMQGVDLEPGSHRVDFVFRPMSAYLGGTMSVVGLFGTLAIVFFKRPA
jgi:hypothetical protein